MDFETWLTDLIGDDTRRTASKKSGMAESTLSRQLSRGHLSPEMVIALCRAYGVSPVQGLIDTGYLHPWEVEGPDVAIALRSATNQAILDEIMRRSDPEARHLFGNETTDNVVGLDPATPWPQDYAAQQRDPEPEEGDDDFGSGA